MAKSKSTQLPHFDSLDELVEFVDTHDLGDYLDNMPEVHFDVNLKRRKHLIAIDAELIDKLNLIARIQRTSPEQLVNSWVREKIVEQS
jgi:hypothetical protein